MLPPALVIGCFLVLLWGDFVLGVKVLAWYKDPNGIQNKTAVKYSYPTNIKKGEILSIGTRWYQKKMIPDKH